MQNYPVHRGIEANGPGEKAAGTATVGRCPDKRCSGRAGKKKAWRQMCSRETGNVLQQHSLVRSNTSWAASSENVLEHP